MKEFNLVSLLKVVINKLWLILLVSLVMAALVFSYFKYFVTPLYSSVATIICSNGGVTDVAENGTTIKSSDLSSSFTLIPSYIRILQSEEVFKRVSVASTSGYNYKELKSKITIVNSSTEELFLDIYVVDADPSKTREIANVFAKTGSEYLVEMLPNAYAKPLELAGTGKYYYPNPWRYSVITFFTSAFCLIAVFFVLSILDKRIKNEQDFKLRYNVPILGVVPNYEIGRKREKNGK